MECARRELLEETGYQACDLVELGWLLPDTGRLANRLGCYFAEDVTPADTPAACEEGLEVVLCPLEELGEWILAGRIDHALHLAVIHLAMLHNRLRRSRHAEEKTMNYNLESFAGGKPVDVCVVGGAGHVGLPLAILLADRGLNVLAIDLNDKAIATISQGKMPFLEKGAEPILATRSRRRSPGLDHRYLLAPARQDDHYHDRHARR